MSEWLVPPIVVPALLALIWMAYVSFLHFGH